MLISCLTITRPGRLAQLRRAIECFSHQTHAAREMVIVHDGDEAYAQQIRAIVKTFPNDPFRIVDVDAGKTLGELRNLSVQNATGDLVCQWDDDDLYHPQRLELQHRCLLDSDSDFCFLTDQLHWFQNTGEFFWDDWNIEPYPMNLIQGTLLGRRALLPAYPALSRGEDTPVLQALYQAGAKLAALDGHGYLYIYTYSGANAWDLAHHAAITRLKRLRQEQLEARRETLARELRRYRLPLNEARFPHDGGEVIIALA